MRSRGLLLGLWVLSLLAAALAFLMAFFQILAGSPRAMRVIVGGDQNLNAAIGGSEDETISSRAGRARAEGRRWGCMLCGLLD